MHVAADFTWKIRNKLSAHRPDFKATLVSLQALVLAVLLVGLCWWIGALLVDDQNVMPDPGSVADRFGELISTDSQNSLPQNAWSSLLRILIGWGGGTLAGVAAGIAMASNRWIRGVLDPLIELARPIPPLAFAPLLVIWFGIGELPKMLILAFVAFPVVAISTVASISNIDENWVRAARTLGAGRPYVLRRVTIPASLPGILISIRLANGLCWGTLVAAEIIASTSGLGWLILQAGRYLDTPTIFVGIIAIGVLAFVTDRILRWAEAVLVPWRGKAAS
ncbi:MAG: ABC transporter permease [Solirubrobacterales bacterium]